MAEKIKKVHGLKKKPISFNLLALIFCIEPVIKIIHLKLITGFSFTLLLKTILDWKNKVEVAEYFLLFPLAGIALFRVRKKSYFLLILIQVYGLFKIFTFTPYSWPYFTKEPILLLWGFVLINVLVLLFLLHPKTRRPFFDKTIRWWESKTRYMVDFPCECSKVGDESSALETKVLNISQTGAFIKGDKFQKDDVVELSFQLLDNEYVFKGHVVSVHPFKDTKGMGIQFKGSAGHFWRTLLMVFKLRKAGYRSVDGR